MSGLHTEIGVRYSHPQASPPMQAYDTDAGWDLALVDTASIMPGRLYHLKTGVHFDIPPGWFARIVARSSALRGHGLVVVEGIIDAGYQGEQIVTVYTAPWVKMPVLLEVGDRLAQVIFQPVPHVAMREVPEFQATARGENGYGSSGR